MYRPLSPEEKELTEHIADPALRALYDRFGRDDYGTIEEGERSLPRIADRLAAYEIMRAAAQNIVDDFGEHGDANRALYGDHDRNYFAELVARYGQQVESLDGQGEIFAQFMERRTARSARQNETIAAESKAQAAQAIDATSRLKTALGLTAGASPMALMAALARAGFKPTDDPERVITALAKRNGAQT